MKRWLATSALTLALALGFMLAFASPAHANSTGNKGQPSQSCQALTASPHGFGTAGFTNATTHYAGSAPQNSSNPKSVSQYDVACFQLSSH
jgi:hypothetical protein